MTPYVCVLLPVGGRLVAAHVCVLLPVGGRLLAAHVCVLLPVGGRLLATHVCVLLPVCGRLLATHVCVLLPVGGRLLAAVPYPLACLGEGGWQGVRAHLLFPQGAHRVRQRPVAARRHGHPWW